MMNNYNAMLHPMHGDEITESLLKFYGYEHSHEDWFILKYSESGFLFYNLEYGSLLVSDYRVKKEDLPNPNVKKNQSLQSFIRMHEELIN